MISEEEARKSILERVVSGGVEEKRTAEAAGRYLARDYRAGFPSPAFDNSGVDGYAIRWLDGADAGAILKVAGEQPAGVDRGLSLGMGKAIRIFTGAPIPQGTTAVIMQEDEEIEEDRIVIRDPVAPGANIRKTGADFCEGQLLGSRGERVTPQLVALLASQGHAAVLVGKRPEVEIVTTGDEVREAGVLRSGEIYNSNGPMLKALAMEAGAGEVRRTHAMDDEADLTQKIQEALGRSDLIVLAGGVSVGAKDHVKGVLAACGVEIDFWRVCMKPGKPFVFGVREKGVSGGRHNLVFGLPGNPASAFVTWHRLVEPALLRWMGVEKCLRDGVPCELATGVSNFGDRPHYMRGELESARLVFHPAGVQQSHALFGMSRSNALARIEAGAELVRGQTVIVYRLS